MAASIDNEISEIEQGEFMSSSNNSSSFNHTAASGKKSSMGSVDTFNSNDYEKGDILLGFPSRGATMSPQTMGGNNAGAAPSLKVSGKAKQRNSVSLNPMAMMSALAGLDLNDSDDDEKAPSPQPLLNPKASGGPEHRPLVGGFAAAAYEAARVDHYKKQGMNVKGHNPPKPRSRNNYPRYA